MCSPRIIFVVLVFLSMLTAGCQQSPGTIDTSGKPAGRVISLAPNITELVFAAGSGDKLVGVVEFSDYPPAAQQIPRIGDAFRVDYEAIAMLRPDLVLAWESGTPRETVEQLRSLGFRVVNIEPANINDIAAELLHIGELTGTRAVAEQQAGLLLAEMANLRKRYAGQRILSAFFQISAEPLFTVNGKHVISDIIEVCGGRNIFADLPALAPAVSVESVLAANPDVIIAAANDGDLSGLTGWRIWQQMNAVVNDNLYTIDRDLITRSGPRIVAGARQVCSAFAEARSSSP